MRGRVLFISDNHFGHQGAIEMCARPYETVAQMDAAMITAWNAAVGARDIVVHGGDFAFGSQERAQWIFDRLNGRKILVKGNHDKAKHLSLGWESVHDILDMRLDGQRIVVCHYPMREWPGYYRNAIHLFGHTHDTQPSGRRALDIGVDSIGITPLTLAELQAKMATLPELEWRHGHEPVPSSEVGLGGPQRGDEAEEAVDGYGRENRHRNGS